MSWEIFAKYCLIFQPILQTSEFRLGLLQNVCVVSRTVFPSSELLLSFTVSRNLATCMI